MAAVAAGAAADSTAKDVTAVRVRRRSMRAPVDVWKTERRYPVITNAPHAPALRNPKALPWRPTA
ncbi:hypothetical protein GCM10018966_032680 [Streptomyces yanii]